MNNFETVRLFNKILDNSRTISINLRVSFLNDNVVIDKINL